MRGDPEKSTEYNLRRRTGLLSLAALGAVGFVAVSIWMLLAPTSEAGLPEKAAAAIGVVFFGLCAVIAARRIGKSTVLGLTPEGFRYDPGQGEKLVRWRDIAGARVMKVSRQDFNIIVLSDAEPLIAQFTPAQARAHVARVRGMRYLAGATVPVMVANSEFEDMGEMVKYARGGKIATLAEALAYSRAMFGGEIVLGWADRDRGAPAFDELFKAWLRKYRAVTT